MPFFWVGGLTVSLLAHLHAGATVITAERTDSTADARHDRAHEADTGRRVVARRPDHVGSHARDRDLAWLVDLQPPELLTPGRRHNSLGMSETGGPHTAASPAANADELPEDLWGSFGPPVPGVQHKIVDPETGRQLPDGEEGEICVRGYSLMAGLYKRERSDTFDEDGWYHTGDGGFFRDGLLFFTGRRTEMIKTAGANVAPTKSSSRSSRSRGCKRRSWSACLMPSGASSSGAWSAPSPVTSSIPTRSGRAARPAVQLQDPRGSSW